MRGGAGALRWAREGGFSTVHVDTEDVAGPDGVRHLRQAAADFGVTLGALAVEKLADLGHADVSPSYESWRELLP